MVTTTIGTTNQHLQNRETQVIGANPNTVRFLNALFRDKPQSLQLLIWEIQTNKEPKEKISYWATSVEQAAHFVAQCPATSNVYFGLGLAPAHGFGRRERCRADEIAGITCLWADIDFGPNDGVVHKKDGLPPDLDSALQLLSELPYAPSIVWHTGYGLQAAWILKQPWIFASDTERKAAANMVAAWQSVIRKKATQHNWTIDSTQDLARVFRVVGSYNNNRPGLQPEVYILHYDPELRYDRTTFATEAPIPQPKSVSAGTTPPPMRTDDQIVVQARNAKNGAKFSALFDRGDTSAYGHDDSSADEALCFILAFWTQEPAQIDRIFRRSALYREKWERADYQERTIAKALGRVSSHYGDQPNAATPDSPRYELTDIGNADRFVAQHGHNVRYVAKESSWYVFDGTRWRKDDLLEIENLAQTTALTIFREAARAADVDDPQAAKKLASWAMRSQAKERVKAMVELARSRPGIATTLDTFDQDLWKFNVLNGTIDLHTGTLLPHDRDDLITKLAPVHYDPDALCPQFHAFIQRTFSHNGALIAYVQRALGYTLTGNTSEKVLFVGHGDHDTGKSTLVAVIHAIMGDYAWKAETALFELRKGDAGIANDVVDLRGRRFVYASETEKGKQLAEKKLKEITGNDQINARQLYEKSINFRPICKLWLLCNDLPVVSGDPAIWRRIRVISFPNQVPEAEQDHELEAKLLAEQPGILAWLVQGCLAWQDQGLAAPPEVTTATTAYKADSDSFGAWCAEECIFAPDAHIWVSEAYDAYRAWCDDMGNTAITKKAFGKRLTERGCTQTRTREVRIWQGVTLHMDAALAGIRRGVA